MLQAVPGRVPEWSLTGIPRGNVPEELWSEALSRAEDALSLSQCSAQHLTQKMFNEYVLIFALGLIPEQWKMTNSGPSQQ